MKDLFIVCENFNQSDHEDWQHWVETRDLSYHSTREHAMVTIGKLIENNKYIQSLTKDKFRSCESNEMEDIYTCRVADLQG